MGCCGSNAPIEIVSDDERIIFLKQLEMGLHTSKAVNLVSQFAAKENQGFITIAGLKEVLASLKIDSSFLSFPTNPFNSFYRSIGNSEQIDAKKLKIVCVLLGLGSEEEKVSQLYKIYIADEMNKVESAQLPAMDIAKFELMIRDVFATAIKMIWVAQGDDEETISKSRLRIYETKLVASLWLALGLVKRTTVMAESSISLEDLKTKAKNLPAGLKTLIDPYQIRQFLLKQYRPFDIKNAAQIFESKIKSILDKNEEESEAVVADTAILLNSGQPSEKPIDLNKPFTCDSGHALAWANDVPFHYKEISGTWMIFCNLCGKNFSTGCWHCRDCKYDVCEECGLAKNMTPPKLLCSESKELQWRCDVVSYYLTNYGSTSYSCNECQGIGDDAHWHCRTCLYDLCRKCGTKHGYKYPRLDMTCRKNHRLAIENNIVEIYQTKYGGFPRCDECRAPINSACQHCNECDYDLCDSCSSYYSGPIGPHPGFLCPEEHILHYADSCSYYESIGKPKSFMCNGCKLTKAEECFHCRKCCFDLCNDCADSLALHLSSPYTKKCENDHLLRWNNKSSKNYSGGAYSCNECGEIFSKVGSFNCAECSYDICIRDMNK
ncbi:unnamed protein product [Blepharisma stoltei]|uniref:ZZ-type domain-containing protein n=1 Tax=Blepharisma stoltei TaxID=1481888 RepID=A0AAU9I5E2_9CILI|nr:unnamed protein product [Blepharisma stoltei]